MGGGLLIGGFGDREGRRKRTLTNCYRYSSVTSAGVL